MNYQNNLDNIYENMPFEEKWIKVAKIFYPEDKKDKNDKDDKDNKKVVKKVINKVRFEGTDETGQSYLFYGTIPGLCEKEIIRISGKYTRSRINSKYTWRVKIETFSDAFYINANDIVPYFKSLGVENVGKQTAEKIKNRFGDDTSKMLFDYPESLSMVEGLKESRIKPIIKAIIDKKRARKCYSKMLNEGLSYQDSFSIIDKYGESTLKVFDEDPYRIPCEIGDVSVQSIDKVLRKRGLKIDFFDEKRLAAIVMSEVRNASNRGSTCVLCSELEADLQKRLFIKDSDKGLFEQKLSGAKALLSAKGLVNYDYKTISQKTVYAVERDAAHLLKVYAKSYIENPFENNDLLFQGKGTELLSDEQRTAVENVFKYPVSIITGGPGTGKSFLTKYIFDACTRVDLECQASAPTGRAAKRLYQAIAGKNTNLDKEISQTIHKLLGMIQNDGKYEKNENVKISKGVLIVDESSMIDVFLADDLLKAIEMGTRIVFIGDPNQLPSVNAGNFFLDMIESGCIPVTRLTNVFRQEEGNVIIENARRINSGLFPITADVICLPNDNYFHIEASGQDAVEAVKDAVLNKLPTYFGVDPVTEIQIYTPVHNGRCGTIQLNNTLRELLNKTEEDSTVFYWGNKCFRIGDKVMQTRNNYGLGIMNGDIGFVESIDLSQDTIQVKFEDNQYPVPYSGANLKDLEIAYAMTVHKSQGSEIPCAIIVIDPDNGKLPAIVSRQLIYTAVTRAKKAVVLIGKRSMFQNAIDHVQINSRRTMLKEHMKKYFAAV